MAAKTGMTVSVKIDGLTEKLATFKKLGDKQAIGNGYLRAGSFTIANDMVGWTRSAAAAFGHQAPVLARFTKVRQDRVPVVVVSPTGKQWVGEKDGSQREGFRTLAGSEFGGRGHGFQPWAGKTGHWFFATADAHQAEVSERWNQVANAIIDGVNAGDI